MFVSVRKPCGHTTNKAFQTFQVLWYIHCTIINFGCCWCARMRFHCANGLLVLRICAP